jgi:TetR/AcrR family acrAB operon transcriptional repressor
MARCTKEEALETRNRILDAAENIFHTQGVAHTSLADVAEAANVTRGAIYWHFKNKHDLFDAMCARVRLPMEAMKAAAADKHASDPLSQLRTTGIIILEEAVNNPHSQKVFDILCHKCEFVDVMDPIFVRQQECHVQGGANIERIISEAISVGQLPFDLDPHLGRIAFHAMLLGLLNNWLFAPTIFDLGKDAEKLIDASLEMLKHTTSLRKKVAA